MVPNYCEKNYLDKMFFMEHNRETGAKTNANVIMKENEQYRFYSCHFEKLHVKITIHIHYDDKVNANHCSKT